MKASRGKGRKTVEYCKKIYGEDVYKEWGKARGLATLKNHGIEHFQKIGKKGGLTMSRNREHMREIGRKGGKASAKAYVEWLNKYRETEDGKD